ncbi:MAG TPA: ribosome maturation factor RimP [Eggerthellaceae bacterium]|nr:ribosome maturation factor RimP [Eggerthellaceae bacterium]
MLTGKARMILEALEPHATAHDMEIVTVELVGSRKAPTIRVYLDCEGGIGFDELSSAQEWVNSVMDELDPFPGAYTLEVSSPGIDRPLRTLEHFSRFTGEKAQIVLKEPYLGRAKWVGILAGVEDNNVLLSVDGIDERLPYDQIKKAHIIGQIDFSG